MKTKDHNSSKKHFFDWGGGGGGGQWYVYAPPPPLTHTHTFNPTFLFSTWIICLYNTDK